MTDRWRPGAIFPLLRIQTWADGQPVKAVHRGILAALFERSAPADGKCKDGIVRNRKLAAFGLGPDVGAWAGRPEDLGAARSSVREALRRALDLGVLVRHDRPGKPPIFVWQDDRIRELAAPRLQKSSVSASPLSSAPAEGGSKGTRYGSEPGTEASPVQNETPPSLYDPRARLALDQQQHTPLTPQGGGLADLDILWASGHTRARRTRGVQGFNGAEISRVAAALQKHGFETVKAALEAEILAAAGSAPRMDIALNTLDGQPSPPRRPAGRGPRPQRGGGNPANPVALDRARWRTPAGG